MLCILKHGCISGCGLNVFNDPPMTSLVHLLAASSPRRQTLSMERTAAVILVRFERMWNQFIDGKGSFEPFLESYLSRWMHRYPLPDIHIPHSLSTNIHSDQQMMLTTVTPPVPVRIRGITLDHGLLRTVLERPKDTSFDPWSEEEFVDLQPDGNSFDLMKGMIKTKR